MENDRAARGGARMGMVSLEPLVSLVPLPALSSPASSS
jgi:hypothetical protein